MIVKKYSITFFIKFSKKTYKNDSLRVSKSKWCWRHRHASVSLLTLVIGLEFFTKKLVLLVQPWCGFVIGLETCVVVWRVGFDGPFVDACSGILVLLRLVLDISLDGGGARLADTLGITPYGPPIVTGFG